MAEQKETKELIEEVFQEALAKIRKIKKDIELKKDQSLSFKEKEEINSLLDKIKNEF